TVKAIRQVRADAPVVEQVLEGRGHDVTLASDGGFTLPFLAGHVRDPFPRRVRVRTRTVEDGRRYWLAVDAKDDRLAEVDGEIGSDGVVRLETKKVRRVRLLLRRELVAAPGPLRVHWNGREAFSGDVGEDCALLARTWRDTADPFLAWSAEIALDRPH